jgi:uncharacterized phage protein (TIGR02220 family)
MAGWVKLHRDIESWEWIDDPFIYWVFTRMILMANHDDRRWQGVDIKRGSFVTSSDNLALKFRCGRQKMRTALDKLKSTNEITIKTTQKYSVISIVNYEKYNGDNQLDNQQITNKQPTVNQQITTTKELNNSKNKRNNNTMPVSPDVLAVLELMNSILGTRYTASKNNVKFINARLTDGFVLNDFETVLRAKHRDWAENADMVKFLRPETLFGNKFEGYLQAASMKPKTKADKLAAFFESEGVQPISL